MRLGIMLLKDEELTRDLMYDEPKLLLTVVTLGDPLISTLISTTAVEQY